MKNYLLVLLFLFGSFAYAGDDCSENLNQLLHINYGDATCTAMKNYPDGAHSNRSYSVQSKSYSLETAIKDIAASCDDVVLAKKRTRVICTQVVCEYNCTELSCEKKHVDLIPYYKNKPNAPKK